MAITKQYAVSTIQTNPIIIQSDTQLEDFIQNRADIIDIRNIEDIPAHAFEGKDIKVIFGGYIDDTGYLWPDGDRFNKLKSIGEYAFYNCQLLKSNIKFPSTITFIPEHCFEYTYKLGEISFNGFTSIGIAAFAHCHSSVFRGEIQNIYDYAFFESELNTIGPIYGFVGEAAFKDCKNLRSVALTPDTMLTGEDIFSGCTSLTTIRFQGTLAQWENMISEANSNWKRGSYITTVQCNNGNISL